MPEIITIDKFFVVEENILKILLKLSREAYRYQKHDMCHYRYLESLEEIIKLAEKYNFIYWKNLTLSVIKDWNKETHLTEKSYNNLRKLIKSIKKKYREYKNV